MGLFGFGKKKETDQENAADAVEYNRIAEKVNIREQSYANDENRRFVMMIEEAFPAKDNEGIVTVGMMRGTIKNGDAVYLLEPGDQISMVNVIGLAVSDGGEMKPVEEAANRIAGVKIYDIAGRKKAEKYAVLTSVKPQINRKDPASIENPYVWGLSFGYRKFMKDTDYFDIFISELLMTNVLVLMHKRQEGYAMLSRPNQSYRQGRGELFAFTDKYQLLLGDWNRTGEQGNTKDQEHAGERQDDLRIVAMRFTDCIDMICSQNGKIAGIALNAYGKFPIVLSEEILNTIYKSGEFQRIVREQEQQVEILI